MRDAYGWRTCGTHGMDTVGSLAGRKLNQGAKVQLNVRTRRDWSHTLNSPAGIPLDNQAEQGLASPQIPPLESQTKCIGLGQGVLPTERARLRRSVPSGTFRPIRKGGR